jgi:uncharacterized Ntn-hydrolase superfamily protein
MTRTIHLIAAFLVITVSSRAQDTFSIVAVDTITGEVGSAGGSCVDLFTAGITDIGFLGDLFPGVGAINTQAAYYAPNQANARTRMLAGDTPAQIIAWLQSNDAQGVADANNRQYGVVRLIGSGSQAAAHTGSACMAFADHRVGANYSIQGNILLGPQILDSMQAHFLGSTGSLAQKLMYALQGAKVIGADTRCADNNSSSLFAFLEVAAPGDPDDYPYISLGVRTHDGAGIEPIDSLQALFDSFVGIGEPLPIVDVRVFPDPASTAVHLVLPARVGAKGELSLIDQAGRRQIVPMRAGDGVLHVDVSHLDAGLYHLTWSVGGVVRVRSRFVKE